MFSHYLWFVVFHQCAQIVLYQTLSWTNPNSNLKLLPCDDVVHSTNDYKWPPNLLSFPSPCSDAVITWLVSTLQWTSRLRLGMSALLSVWRVEVQRRNCFLQNNSWQTWLHPCLTGPISFTICLSEIPLLLRNTVVVTVHVKSTMLGLCVFNLNLKWCDINMWYDYSDYLAKTT